MTEKRFFLPEISLNVLYCNQCEVNLPLFILQIMSCTINSFQLLTNRSIWVEVNIEYLRLALRYSNLNGFQVTTWILSQARCKH